jgi:hypothetical protein
MAALKLIKFRDIEEANHVLAGGILGGECPAAGIPELVGKTITFSAPAGTKTFTQPSDSYQGMLRFKDIKAQLEAAITNLQVRLIKGRLAFRHATPATAVALTAVNETGRAPLGLPNNEAVSGTAYAGPGGSSPKVDQFYVQNDTVYVLTE